MAQPWHTVHDIDVRHVWKDVEGKEVTVPPGFYSEGGVPMDDETGVDLEYVRTETRCPPDNNESLAILAVNLLCLMEIDGYPVRKDSTMGDEMKMVLRSPTYKRLRALLILRGYYKG